MTSFLYNRFAVKHARAGAVYPECAEAATLGYDVSPRRGKGNLITIVVPPLREQHRIVAKVDEFMSLCHRLESQLTTGETESCRLLESVLHEALKQSVSNEIGWLSKESRLACAF